MLIVPAHAGHWLAELMYVMPVLAIVVWISIRAIIDRRNADGSDDQTPPEPLERL
jgi:hypothetical protein